MISTFFSALLLVSPLLFNPLPRSPSDNVLKPLGWRKLGICFYIRKDLLNGHKNDR